MTHGVFFSPEAKSDLEELYEYIALHIGEDRALAFVERIEHWIEGLALFPTIDFRVGTDTVTILRILYAGRELERELPSET